MKADAIARHVHLDALGGIAGDMFVAAMLDALPDLASRVLADVAAVVPARVGQAALTAGASGGLRALRFGLRAAAADVAAMEADEGSYAAITARIGRAELSAGTADAAHAILSELARVEARIHGVPVEQVHFHEIGSWDSLMDVVAAGSLAAALAGSTWSVSELPLGSGTVRSQHGRLPVPAPATAELLRGFRFRDDRVAGERVTPTGAAILRHLVSLDDAPRGNGRLVAAGTGAGTRELPGMPNVLRALVFDTAQSSPAEHVAVVTFDIDDMTGEEMGIAAERLREVDGVLDVCLGARLGKKGRPLTTFRLLVRPGDVDRVQAACFAQTSTLGLRWRLEHRAVLPREVATVMVDGSQPVRVKRAVREGEVTRKAESDDLAHLPSLQARRTRKTDAENGSR